MVTKVKKVKYFAVEVANRTGEAARVLNALAKDGINLLAFTGFPSGKHSQMDFIPEDAAAFRVAARRAKLKTHAAKSGFLIQGNDAPGVLGRTMRRLAKARINVTAVDAVCAGKKRYGAILWVKAKDVVRAARALGA